MLRAINPATGELVREIEPDRDAIVSQKLDAARAAFSSWRKAPFSERAALLRAVAKHLRDHAAPLGALMTEEMGKPQKEALGEINKSALCADHYAEHAESYLRADVLASDATKSYVQYLPLGTVLSVLPWNAPFWLTFRVCAPALMAGNACLIKHDPNVPGCAQALAKVFVDVGAPAGLFDVLLLETERVEPVLRDRRVQAVSFTGSTRGGRAVASIAASEIKPAVLELGGSDPMLVLEDADLELAAQLGTTMRTINAGQSCIAAKRMLVVAGVHDAFVEKLEARLRSLEVGDPRLPETDVGPIARADLRATLHRQVTATVGEGARCRLGGELPSGPGFFYPVTLLTGVTPSMTAFREETFGPVAAVTCVNDEAEALALANQSDYGLAASVFTNAARGESLAREIEAGQVVVNGVVKTDPRLPSGGIKCSGYGRELGPHGIHELVNAQQVWIGPAR